MPAAPAGDPLTGGRALAGLALGLSLVAACAAPAGRHPHRPAAPHSSAAQAVPTPSPSSRPRHTPVAARPGPLVPGAATRPQTMASPSATTAVFHRAMADLWAAVVSGRAAPGMPAFFPLGAYRQVKAIADPTADWHDRLVAEYRLDVEAAHALLGRSARRARLLRVIVPAAEASWIPPGACYNSIGYWHVAGARVVYRVGTAIRSFGIASLISWRGVWYVVHFGAVIRNTPGGVVDQPSAGSGVPGPPGGC